MEVLVSLERLQHLETLEATVEERIKKGIEEGLEHKKKETFEKLKQRDKEIPGNSLARAKKYYERHKEEINAKRREKRKLEKETASGNV